MADGKKVEWKNRENNNMKINFSTTANIYVRILLLPLLDLIFEPIPSESFD